MRTASFLCLILQSAISGASFLFMRIGAPALGPVLLIFLRVLIAAIFLFAMAAGLKKTSLNVRQHWRHYLILGFFNTALPFVLFAYAAVTVSASLLSVLNATAPILGGIIGAVWHRTRLSLRALLGLMLGIFGVALLTGVETLDLPAGGERAMAAAVGGALCYAIATLYAQAAEKVDPFANTHGSMWAATLLMLPAMLFAPWPTSLPEAPVIGAVIALGVLCSGIAYLLYYWLVADIGATPALTVTFLIPVFGILWGWLFLDETMGWHTLAGSVIVLSGTALVTGYSFWTIFPKNEKNAPGTA